MAHTDPYRLTTAPTPTPTATAGGTSGVTRGDVVRTLLWTVVVISAVANTVASYGGVSTWVHLSCGTVTLLAASTLVVRSLRGRR
ncbi:hypothetical protein KQY30_16650 [Streptomyces sp. GMY02]|uniref:hypothetical protein n=1 Tax=Streptomyces sp. GMY02 TaxID=1333528 RepID=UPI001C2BFFF0|nr:hypothetical protein [Streptomyces sp. GMY02]QXE35646.1 hypothetical protein KQY30_16650 [Streptomyces sp. GMY02]